MALSTEQNTVVTEARRDLTFISSKIASLAVAQDKADSNWEALKKAEALIDEARHLLFDIER